MCSIKKVFLETLAQVFSCEFCKFSKNTFSDRRLPVAGSVICNLLVQLDSAKLTFFMLNMTFDALLSTAFDK